MRSTAGATALTALAASLAAAAALASPGAAVTTATAAQAAAQPAGPGVDGLLLPCGSARDALATYGWPLKPFDRAHPIRGSFGDPRTVERSAEPQDGPGSRGSFQFHNGLDIVADDGTPVYPVLSGIADVRHSREVSVRTPGGRVFQYWHIVPRVRSGQQVVRGVTVLGTIQRGAHHVHLTEIDRMRVVNPLAAGHLGPYADTQQPVVHALLVRTPGGSRVPLDRLKGKVALIADAADAQPLPFWGPWFGKPVAPAVIRWRMLAADGSVVQPWATAFDVRLDEPPPVRFWRVYAKGTYQNFPVLDDHFDWGRPGRYLFRLTHDLVDTRALPDGSYVVEVQASDICGNTGSLRQQVTVANPDTRPDVKDGTAPAARARAELAGRAPHRATALAGARTGRATSA